MKKSDVGLVGLGVMGQSLVLNLESKGYSVSVYNRTAESTKEFMENRAADKCDITAAYSLKELVESLKEPKKIMLMVKAGQPVDDIINSLLPYLSKGDIILDSGNSYFRDTVRRYNELKGKGILYMGVGVSGGEEGALKGPSIMPGGSAAAWNQVEDMLKAISAKAQDGVPCCDYIGEDGAGHYVKMVHNGIEYGDMELISETYFLMKELLGMTAGEMKEVYEKWNNGELNSYLIQITSNILGKTDDLTGKPIVDVIYDVAGEKGTGCWMSGESLELKIPIPTVTEALYARYMSMKKDERTIASKKLKGPKANVNIDRKQIIDDIEKALYASKICSYAQGFDLMKRASQAYGWNLNLGDISMLWRGGCIIRAQFLSKIKEAYDDNSELSNLLLAPYFTEIIDKSQEGWRRVVSLALLNGIPVPALSSALSYYDSYRNDRLPANMIQAQRDYFGSHTYKRIDREGIYHTIWE